MHSSACLVAEPQSRYVCIHPQYNISKMLNLIYATLIHPPSQTKMLKDSNIHASGYEKHAFAANLNAKKDIP